jgi:hypothetical protein
MHLPENKSHLTDVVSRQFIEQLKVIMTGEKHVITSGTFKDIKKHSSNGHSATGYDKISQFM